MLILIRQGRDCKPLSPSLLTNIQCLHSPKAQMRFSRWFEPLVYNNLVGSGWSSGSEFQFSSVTQPCPTLWDPMDCSTSGLPVHHQLPEFTQPHVHWVDDAIQQSDPLSSSSYPAFNLSQHQSLFKWVSSSHQVTKVLEFQLQHQSFQWTLRTDLF